MIERLSVAVKAPGLTAAVPPLGRGVAAPPRPARRAAQAASAMAPALQASQEQEAGEATSRGRAATYS